MTERNKNRDPGPAAGKAPFIFGVSGHRDLVPADLPQLRAQLEIIFSRFRSAYPEAAFQLLSPLAEGADRLAAELALARGIKLLVPMPMAQEEYERDFADPASLDDFRRLLAAAELNWQIPNESEPTKGTLSANDARAEKYAAVGDYIARKSHVLILLWDGRDNEKIGGTAWVRKRREHWIKAAKKDASEPDAYGYVQTIQIVTPRVTAIGSGRERPRVEIVGDLPASQAAERSKL
jgi:hypothetical protein